MLFVASGAFHIAKPSDLLPELQGRLPIRVELKPLLEMPDTDQAFIQETLATKDHATLAHLFFRLHFYLVERSGEWIHDGHV